MDTTEIVVVLAGLLLIGLTLWFFFGQREEPRPTEGEMPTYACPMHPWITSTDPTATCSLCGMQLVRQKGGKP